MNKKTEFTIGLVVNPHAGVGGPAGLKGSDLPNVLELAAERGVTSKVPERVAEFCRGLIELIDKGCLSSLKLLTCSGIMGEQYLKSLFSANSNENSGVSIESIYHPKEHTCANDTLKAVQQLNQYKLDLLVFVGGDGTARDVCSVVDKRQLVLGLPAGVKMHSGVFAVTPHALVSVVESMLSRKLVAARMAEVRDIDEEAFRHGRVSAKYYGEMLIPDDQLLVQAVKCSGMLDDEIMLDELSEYIAETLEPDSLYILGSGGTLRRVKQRLGIDDPTLLGVDVIYVDADGDIEIVEKDAYETHLFELLQKYEQARIIISIIGGQGVVLGRGNQQLSARVIEQVGLDNLHFVSTQNKLLALEGRALRVDSGSDELNHKLAGFHPIICGYDDVVLYEVAYL